MNKLKVWALATGLAAVTAIGAVGIATNGGKVVFADTPPSYSCASVHFGMKDSDNTAMTYDPSTSSTDLSGYYTASAGLIKSIECANVYVGGPYTASDDSYSQYAIRVGKSKGLGTLAITFNQKIIGCTVYAVPYIGNNSVHEPVVMKVNGQEVDLSEAAGTEQQTKVNAVAVTYIPYSFIFDATDTVTLTAKQASKTVNGKSVSACRYYVADIALRVKS